MKIFHIVGNRPQFIKLAVFLNATYEHSDIHNIIIHSGQHYGYEMSKIFFDDLKIPKVDYNLEVGSGTHGFQTGNMLVKLDPVLSREQPDVVVVYGDTNTTLAGALSAYKQHLPIVHVESGMREHIWRPEEMNKKIADHCSDFCFCPLKRACDNLAKEGIPEEKIFLTGDITCDAFLQHKDIALKKVKIEAPKDDYILMTMHRAETVDIFERVKGIVEAIVEIPLKVIFPVHPRTKKQLSKFGLFNTLENSKNIKLLDPISYFEFIKLLLDTEIVITDSSGVLKEAFYAQKMCVTIDESTEYIEIFDMGYNILAGTKKKSILIAVENMLSKEFIPPKENPLGDGNAGREMVKILKDKL